MAEYRDERGRRCFRPDNTETEFYYCFGSTGGLSMPLDEIFGYAQAYFEKVSPHGDRQLGDFEVKPMHIHTQGLDYDQHDPYDYEYYLKFELAR